MKPFLLLTATMLACALPHAHPSESRPLWPEGKIPHAKPDAGEEEIPRVDIYPTAGSKKHNGAAVVVCPGGGYGSLAKDHEGHQIAQWYNERGVTAFVLTYRLGSQGYHFPVQLADVQRALRLARAGAEEFKIDPGRVGVMGFSAGGHLASMAATKFGDEAYPATDDTDKLSARPDFAALCYPVISLEKDITHGGSRKNLLGPDRADDDIWAERLSSDRNVAEDTPPVFLFHTAEDTAVPVENSLRFFSAMRKHGVPGEMHLFQKGVHGVGLFQGDPVLRHWSELLDLWLRNNGWYSGPRERTAISGEVSLDGKPVDWGSLTFHPQDGKAPITTVRVRKGKFSAKKEDGPVLGKSRIVFEGSIWETTGKEKDKRVRLEKLVPKAMQPLSLDVEPDHPRLQFEYSSK